MQRVSVKVLSRNFVYQRHFCHHGDMKNLWISIVLHVVAKNKSWSLYMFMCSIVQIGDYYCIEFADSFKETSGYYGNEKLPQRYTGKSDFFHHFYLFSNLAIFFCLDTFKYFQCWLLLYRICINSGYFFLQYYSCIALQSGIFSVVWLCRLLNSFCSFSTNSVVPEHAAPRGAVWSGLTLFNSRLTWVK